MQNGRETKSYLLFPWRKDYHRHLEGALFVKDLRIIAEEFGVGFDWTTIEDELVNVRNERKSFERFIRLLSTRWMRLIIAKIMTREKLSDEEAHYMVRECVARFIEVAVKHAVEVEKLSLMNLLYCPLSLTVDGDLEEPYISSIPLLGEEIETYEKFKGKEMQDRGITWEEYVDIAGEMRQYLQEKYGITIILSTSFRKDKDKKKLQDRNWVSKAFEFLDLRYIDEVTDCVDLCGPENDEHVLSNYPYVIEEYLSRFIQKTFHGGEVHFKNKAVGYENLHIANEIPTLLATAHAVRFEDQNPEAEQLNEDHRRQGSAVWLNLRSNIETGLFGRGTLHRFIINRMKKGYDLLSAVQNIFDNAVPCTDDPNVYTIEPEDAMKSELMKVIQTIHSLSRSLFDKQQLSTMTVMKIIRDAMKKQEEDFFSRLTKSRENAREFYYLNDESF